MAVAHRGLLEGAVISGLFFLAILGGIGFALWSGFGRVMDPAERQELDASRVVRSIAIAVGMYLAMLAITVGLIDLFQAVVGGDRLAGSNADLARALSLLLVATPVFGLLARLVDRQRAERRAAGDHRGGIGWSVHLVAALTTTLIGSLVSCAQLIDDVGAGRDIEKAEVAQLVGWLLVWVVYWIGLRPRLGVRGHLHLLIGSVLGLGWTVAGLAGLGTELGGQAYANAFADPLVTDANLTVWLLVAVVGVLTWVWHWRTLDSPVERGIETRPRRSPAWFAMVVGAGIVPGLIALLMSIGGVLTGTLIWFLGSPGEEAVEWFDEAPSVITVGLIALAVWAYHRWLLLRDGDPVRNEAIRFHDYVVAGVGLAAVVAGVALIVSLVLDALTADSLIASSLELDNRLIGTLVVLALGAGLWWRTWERIDVSRRADPVAECDSTWRKLYLIVAAGLGGLILAGCLIWVLFTVLQDLFDGDLSVSTLQELSGPIGWALAVLAGVWFHIGVWRADRAVLDAAKPQPATGPALAPLPPPPPSPSLLAAPPAAVAPSASSPPAPPPPAPSAVMLASAPARQAEPTDAPTQPAVRWAVDTDRGELFTLQRAAFVDEAKAYDTPEVPALTESFEAFQARFADVRTLVVSDHDRLVGAVAVRVHDELPWLERLMVAPDRRNEQLGHALVTAMVGHVQAEGHSAIRAVVGDRNPLLLDFYASLGFTTVGRTAATANAPELLVMERPIEG